MSNLLKNIFKSLSTKKQNNQIVLQQKSKEELENAKYQLCYVVIAKLAKLIDKRKRNITVQDIDDSVVSENTLAISIGNNWFMDIETGKYYELGGILGEEMTTDMDVYVERTRSLFHFSYDEVKKNNMQPLNEYSAKELRDLYNEHIQNHHYLIEK